MDKERFHLKELDSLQPALSISDWRSSLLCRLIGTKTYADGYCALFDSFRAKAQPAKLGRVTFEWSGMDDEFSRCLHSYQDAKLTELAALAVACVLVRVRANLNIVNVTRWGERADYWIGDRELLLEVSGLVQGSLEGLFRRKAIQLKRNPFGKDGYVCVVNFKQLRAKLWFQKCEGADGPE